jgi:hypothetical protein
MKSRTKEKKPKTRKQKIVRAFAIAAGVAVAFPALAACTHQSDVVSSNLSNAADNYQVNRQINFIDTITGQNIETVTGLCSLGNNDVYPQMTLTCKTGVDKNGKAEYVKDFFEVTPTTTVSVMQLGSSEVSSAHYSVTFAPGTLVPNFNTAGNALPTTPSVAQPSASASAAVASNSNAKPKVKVVVIQAIPSPSSSS